MYFDKYADSFEEMQHLVSSLTHLLVEERPEDRDGNVEEQNTENSLDVGDQLFAVLALSVVQPVFPLPRRGDLPTDSVLPGKKNGHLVPLNQSGRTPSCSCLY